jgi:ATPase subunit of ABC transporter with duplicated ATPase domains
MLAAGKSTLLKLIAEEVSATQGAVTTDARVRIGRLC